MSIVTPDAARPTFLLAADIDGTLLGDPEGERRFRELREHDPHAFQLAFVTGRYLFSVRDLVKSGRLPAPDFVCVNVGTEIFAWQEGDNPLGQKYAARSAADWDLAEIYALGTGEGVWPQGFGLDQPPFQAGFSWDGQAASLAAMRRRLAGKPRCRILPSYGECIDVLPAGFGKGEAVRFLQQELGLPPELVVVAGDSGNDIEMFTTGFKGILPGNALAELIEAAGEPWHYHSTRPAALGLLDGLAHFGFLDGR
jgi:sucrose-phosphate synthase